MMKKLIADFRGSVYQNGFGFEIEVYKTENDNIIVTTYNVEPANKLNKEYNSFEEFLNELVVKNPLWFTYRFVRAEKKYQILVEEKLKETIANVLGWLALSVNNTEINWLFEKDYINFSVKDQIQKVIEEKYNYFFPESKNLQTLEELNTPEEKWELEQTWNGYCPESHLKGKRVKMCLNNNDLFESEETGLQIVIIKGFQAIILKKRGSGNFRSPRIEAHNMLNGELLSPQLTSRPPFNSTGDIFEDSEEIEKYIKNIV